MVHKVQFVSGKNAGRTHVATTWFNALAHPEKARRERGDRSRE